MFCQSYAWQNIALDGSFSFKIPIGTLEVDQDKKIPLYVTHHLVYDPVTKQAKSQFRIDFLETWIVPKTNRNFLWRQPSGNSLTVSTNAQDAVRANRISDFQIEIICPDNWGFYYTKGQLTTIRLPSGDTWEVDSQAGRIHEINEKKTVGDIVTLRATYLSEKNYLDHLKTSTNEVFFIYEKDLVKSIEITRPGNTKETYLFSYQDKLITQIKTPEKSISISWKKIEEKHYSVLESSSLKPIRVSMINGKRIYLSHSTKGIKTEVFQADNEQPIQRMVNPKIGSIIEYDSNGNKIVISSGKAYR
jgi:hypothetical protein